MDLISHSYVIIKKCFIQTVVHCSYTVELFYFQVNCINTTCETFTDGLIFYLFICFLLPDKEFLVFFFTRLRMNHSGRYEDDFPFLSLCGRERNFLRCDDRPVVFTHVLQSPTEPQGEQELLSYCGGAEKLSVLFRPEALYMHPVSGRVYHPCSELSGGVGLVRSALAIELSPFFVYTQERDQSGQPTYFVWAGQKHALTNELAGYFPPAEQGNGHQGEVG